MDMREVPVGVVRNMKYRVVHHVYKYSFAHTDLVPTYARRKFFVCKICGAKDEDAKSLNAHMREEHRLLCESVWYLGENVDVELGKLKVVGWKYQKLYADRLVCRCGKAFKSLKGLIKHIKEKINNERAHPYFGVYHVHVEEYRASPPDWSQFYTEDERMTNNVEYVERRDSNYDSGYFKVVSVFKTAICEVIVNDKEIVDKLTGQVRLRDYRKLVDHSYRGLCETREAFERRVEHIGKEFLGLPKEVVT